MVSVLQLMPGGVLPAFGGFYFRIGAQGKYGGRSDFLYGRRCIWGFHYFCRGSCPLSGRLGCSFAGWCFKWACGFRSRGSSPSGMAVFFGRGSFLLVSPSADSSSVEIGSTGVEVFRNKNYKHRSGYHFINR